jgi:NADH dehydrogenase/NADH:ubiquinone oxidoreductase subunit G
MTITQCSVLTTPAEIQPPIANEYSAAFGKWQEQFSQFATLEKFSENMTASTQSFEQKDVLVAYVENPANFKALLDVDFGFPQLNRLLRNYAWAAHIDGNSRILKMQQEQQKSASATFIAKQEQEAAEKKESAKRSADLLQQLELKEQLLSIEKEYPTEAAAKKSVYFARASAIADLKAVITEEKRLHGVQYDAQGRRIEYDHDGKRIVYSSTTVYVLSFELIQPSTAA